MNGRIQQILNQITALEDDLRTALNEQQSSMFFQIKGKRVEFEQSIKETHRRLKTNFFRWLVAYRPQIDHRPDYLFHDHSASDYGYIYHFLPVHMLSDLRH